MKRRRRYSTRKVASTGTLFAGKLNTPILTRPGSNLFAIIRSTPICSPSHFSTDLPPALPEVASGDARPFARNGIHPSDDVLRVVCSPLLRGPGRADEPTHNKNERGGGRVCALGRDPRGLASLKRRGNSCGDITPQGSHLSSRIPECHNRCDGNQAR